MEHRWGERFTVDVAVRVQGRPYAVRAGRLIDLSMSGGRIQIPLDLRLLSRIQVAIALPQLPRTHRATPLLSAYVTRLYEGGAGVEWCDFGPQAVVELLRRVNSGRLVNSTSADAVAPAIEAHGSLRRGTRGFAG